MRPRVAAAVVLPLVLVAACATSPTGRTQLMLISPEAESEMGVKAFREVLRKAPVTNDPRYTQPVREVGRRIAAVAGRPDFRWEFVVIDDPKQVNAFALPGGKVAVYTGIFPVAQDTAGLAVVMGHEIGHVLARHGAERVSQNVAAEGVGAAVGAVTGGSPIAMAAYGIGAQVGVLLPYSRTHESEADRVGLDLMAKAGYDPRDAVPFWQRMEKNGGGGKTPEILSTHPNDATRQQQILGWLPQVEPVYSAAAKAPVRRLPDR